VNVFLTGPIQVGKSTAIRRFLSASGLVYDGFLTFFEDVAGGRDLYISPANVERLPRSLVARMRREGEGFSREVLTEAFDTAGLDILKASGRGQIVIMDEIGDLEIHAARFGQAVLDALDGPVPILGVIKQAATGPLARAARSHEKTQLIEVGVENRDEMPQRIAALFGIELKL